MSNTEVGKTKRRAAQCKHCKIAFSGTIGDFIDHFSNCIESPDEIKIPYLIKIRHLASEKDLSKPVRLEWNTTPLSNKTLDQSRSNISGTTSNSIERYIIAKSENALFNSKTFFGMGKIQILLYPFDNVVRFSIASGLSTSPTYFDLSRFDQIRLTFKSDKTEVAFPLYIEAGVVDLKGGQCVFKVTQNKFQDIKKIYDSGINIFYITGTSKSNTSVIYTGLFKIFDNKVNVSELNKQAASENKKIPQDTLSKQIILDDTVSSQTTTVKPPISKETSPIKKPTGLKDISDKLKNKFKK
jgi:hypothetical protein